MSFNCLKATVPLRGDNLLFTTKSPGVFLSTLSGASKDFMKALNAFIKPFAAPQSVKIKV